MTDRVSSTGRAALRESLLQFSAFADALDSRSMREAIDACITVLDAPGPLDKRDLAPRSRSSTSARPMSFDGVSVRPRVCCASR